MKHHPQTRTAMWAAMTVLVMAFLLIPTAQANYDLADPGGLSYRHPHFWSGQAYSSEDTRDLLNASAEWTSCTFNFGASTHPLAARLDSDLTTDIIIVSSPVSDTGYVRAMDSECNTMDTYHYDDFNPERAYITDLDGDDKVEVFLTEAGKKGANVSILEWDNEWLPIYEGHITHDSAITIARPYVCAYRTTLTEAEMMCGTFFDDNAADSDYFSFKITSDSDNTFTVTKTEQTTNLGTEGYLWASRDGSMAQWTTLGNDKVYGFYPGAVDPAQYNIIIASLDPDGLPDDYWSEDFVADGITSVGEHNEYFLAQIGSTSKIFGRTCDTNGNRGDECSAVVIDNTYLGNVRLMATSANDDFNQSEEGIAMSNWAVGDYDNDAFHDACLLYQKNYTVSQAYTWLECWEGSNMNKKLSLNMSNLLPSLNQSYYLGIIHTNISENLSSFATHQGIFHVRSDNTTYWVVESGHDADKDTRGYGGMVVHTLTSQYSGNSVMTVYVEDSEDSDAEGWIAQHAGDLLFCGNGVCEPQFGESTFTCPADCEIPGIDPPSPGGGECDDDDDCENGRCNVYGECELSPGGYACDDDDDCISGTCTDGVCDDAGLWENINNLVGLAAGDDNTSLNLIAILVLVASAAFLVSRFALGGAIAAVPVVFLLGGFFVLVGWLYAWIYIVALVLSVGTLGGWFMVAKGAE